MANCVHGLPESECLICTTLAGSSSQAKPAKQTKVASPVEPLSGLGTSPSRPLATLGSGASSASAPGPQSGRPHGKHLFLTVVGVIVVAGVALWAFGGVFDLAFHIAEYVVLAIAAGWVGYKLGHARGRRSVGKGR